MVESIKDSLLMIIEKAMGPTNGKTVESTKDIGKTITNMGRECISIKRVIEPKVSGSMGNDKFKTVPKIIQFLINS
jgi:hypothetical protein